MPRVLAWRPELSLSSLEAIPGAGLIADALKAQLRGKPFAGAALSLEQMIDAGATIAATLHTSGIQLGRARSLDDQLASLQRDAATRALIDRLGERFLQTYIDMAGHPAGDLEHMVRRVSLYKALSLVRRTLRSWQKFKPSRIESALALLAEEIAVLP